LHLSFCGYRHARTVAHADAASLLSSGLHSSSACATSQCAAGSRCVTRAFLHAARFTFYAHTRMHTTHCAAGCASPEPPYTRLPPARHRRSQAAMRTDGCMKVNWHLGWADVVCVVTDAAFCCGVPGSGYNALCYPLLLRFVALEPDAAGAYEQTCAILLTSSTQPYIPYSLALTT